MELAQLNQQNVSGHHGGAVGHHGPLHTVRISEVTLNEMAHPIWVRRVIGKGLENIWSEYEQIPACPLGEKWEKLLVYYKKFAMLWARSNPRPLLLYKLLIFL